MNPFVVKNIIFPLHESFLSRNTIKLVRELDASQWWPQDKLLTLQQEKLRNLMTNFRHLDYPCSPYQKYSTQDFAQSDFKCLPLLDKTTIKQNLEMMVNRAVPGQPKKYNTGGSSGEPLVFYYDRNRQAYDSAARIRARRWWGIDIGDKELYLWGSPIEVNRQDRLKQVRDTMLNHLLLSAFGLSKKALPQYVERMRRFRPAHVFGYPSSLAALCDMAAQQNYTLTDLGVKVVFTAGEMLYAEQRQKISAAFGGVPVVNEYGSREGGFIAQECPNGSLHITAESIILEIIDPVTTKVLPRDQEGEIVITHLDNHAMPFIRYRTGDIGALSSQECACGRGLPVLKSLQGRSTDFIMTRDGRVMHGLSLIYTVRDLPGVNKYKIIQEELGSIRVLLVGNGRYNPSYNDKIKSRIKSIMGMDTRVDIELRDHIETEKSGKYRFVVSRVPKAG